MKKFKKISKISKFSEISIIHFKNNEKIYHENFDFFRKLPRKSNSEVSPEFKNDIFVHVGPLDQKLEVRTNINFVSFLHPLNRSVSPSDRPKDQATNKQTSKQKTITKNKENKIK